MKIFKSAFKLTIAVLLIGLVAALVIWLINYFNKSGAKTGTSETSSSQQE